ncbi:MAG: cob(I)yrinic acid a,c-diamide adenosyltransferase [Hadesarchaea archaeon]|nr:MAG: cob(I)yrinic acid a,c-diamide adenosyltransferase [Hadesarchaea archaeon]
MGEVYVLTGTGPGKTTGALGLALRAVGQGRRVVIIQFLKWWKNTGEYKVRRRLAPHYEIHQFGRRGWRRKEELGEKDRELVKRGLEFAREVARRKRPDLLILDELNLALAWGMADVGEVLRLLDELPKKTDVVITGRYAPRELVERADAVVEVREVKLPENPRAKKGIHY